MGTGEQSPEPFRTFAGKYLDIGLSVFPCGGDDGKTPLVRWKPMQTKRIGSKGLDKWIKANPMANVAIVTGELSNITVIDSDNPKITLMELFDMYGDSPLVAKTPSGGYHVYYRYNGEGSKTGISQDVDITDRMTPHFMNYYKDVNITPNITIHPLPVVYHY